MLQLKRICILQAEKGCLGVRNRLGYRRGKGETSKPYRNLPMPTRVRAGEPHLKARFREGAGLFFKVSGILHFMSTEPKIFQLVFFMAPNL